MLELGASCIMVPPMERLPIVESTLIVDTIHFTVQNTKSQERFISRELSKALALLVEKKAVSFSEFLKEVFQFKFYDSQYHRQKVYNCLQKVKKLLPPGLKILTRYEKIYLEGEVSQIFVIHPAAINSLPPDVPDKVLKAILVIKNNKKVELSRNDFQKQMGVSKSEAHRLLVSLEELGFVGKEGRGKSTRYIVLESAIGS